MEGRDVLCIMPTGAGKSLCYQVPAILRDSVTIVLSPLISLMKDQVDSLRQNGVRAASINSMMVWDDVMSVIRLVRGGGVRILYIAPERLENERFRGFLGSLDVGLVVVDEAHCVSQWGHDFRPAYLGIAPAVSGLPVRPVVAAFTATATPEVRDDIMAQLSLESPFTMTTGFDRENLFFQVEHPSDKKSFLLDYAKKFSQMSGIVYCSTRKAVEDVAYGLSSLGISAVRYHAGLADAERRKNQEDFIYDRMAVMVATNAFGMGIDKSNVRYVLHYNMPGSIDSYYQEAGRAGRDGLPADCILLFGQGDIQMAKFLISKGEAAESRNAGYRKLSAMVDYCNTGRCLRSFILNYFGETGAPERCDSCGSCVSEVERSDVTLEAQKILSCVYRIAERTGGKRFGVSMLADVLRGSRREQILNLGLDGISTWGIMKDYSAAAIKDMANFLLAENYLKAEDGEFPTLSFTEKTFPFLKGGTRLLMRKHEDGPAREKGEKNEKSEKSEQKSGRRQGIFSDGGLVAAFRSMAREISGKTGKTGKSAVQDEEGGLFEELRALRRKIASTEGVPPYIVFSDKTLSHMCKALPSDEDEMLDIPGVGETKLEKYGGAFLDAIRIWRERVR
jgi:ATP-dependent DNA helicase RecQ